MLCYIILLTWDLASVRTVISLSLLLWLCIVYYHDTLILSHFVSPPSQPTKASGHSTPSFFFLGFLFFLQPPYMLPPPTSATKEKVNEWKTCSLTHTEKTATKCPTNLNIYNLLVYPPFSSPTHSLPSEAQVNKMM
jgi:hypothetical protein